VAGFVFDCDGRACTDFAQAARASALPPYSELLAAAGGGLAAFAARSAGAARLVVIAAGLTGAAASAVVGIGVGSGVTVG